MPAMLAALLLSVAVHTSALLVFNVDEAKERPVTKVLGLLEGMQAQLEKEAEEETKLMETYNCWCKENGDEKAALVADAEARLKEMESRCAELNATSRRLEVEYTNLGKDLAKDEASNDEAVARRKKEVAKFQKEEQDLLNNLNSVTAAENNIKGTKGSEADRTFLQMPSHQDVFRTVQDVMNRHAMLLSDESTDKASAFLQQPTAGGVVGVLEGLRMDFERELKELQDAELKNKENYEKFIKAKRAEIDAAKLQIAQKKEEKTAADEENVNTKENIKDTKASMGEDLAFALEVKKKCGGKAKDWEQRQRTRAEELEAVNKAIKVLSADDAHATFSKTLSFLQESSSDRDRNLDKVAAALTQAGKKHDQRLVTLAMSVKLDSFTRVKEKIDGMIADLKRQQEEEVKKKEYCIDEFQRNRLDTDKKKREEQRMAAQMKELQMKMQKTTDEMKALQSEITELNKQQKIAAETREKENGEFQKIVQEQRETQELLGKALDVLKEFYDKQIEGQGSIGTFIQANPKEPKTFGDYRKSSSANGVLLMLQKLLAEAKEMETESTYAERESQADYEAFAKETAGSVETKKKSVANLADVKAKSERTFVETRKSKEGVEGDIEGLENTAFELHETCDWTLMQFNTMQKGRQDEIDALNQAKSYLSGAVP
eukprot:TRINITY_DN16352_c0_g1_i1.p1 TRINITY_DN16352_c0_g1~~TRINITY_DN16352_c0_g1_i1.p1  ORF type:complete len:683 (+),score=242.34 TRINITY_DN16352_c0_g1_i1:69-2051(+)